MGVEGHAESCEDIVLGAPDREGAVIRGEGDDRVVLCAVRGGDDDPGVGQAGQALELQPQGRAEVRAWYPGRIVSMTRSIGERVIKGQTIASVTSAESLQTYAIPAPISGVIMERNANVGDVAGASPIYVIADATRLHAEFFVYPRDAERLRAE